MNSIFAVACSAMPALYSTKFFTTQALARSYLKKLANERRFKLGVHSFEETTDKFSYLLGWEESYITFYIIELPIEG